MLSIIIRSSWSSFRLSPVTIWTTSSFSTNTKSGPQIRRRRRKLESGRDLISSRVIGCHHHVVHWSWISSSFSLHYRQSCSTRETFRHIGCQNSLDLTWSHSSKACKIWINSGTLPKKASAIICLMTRNCLTQVPIRWIWTCWPSMIKTKSRPSWRAASSLARWEFCKNEFKVMTVSGIP